MSKNDTFIVACHHAMAGLAIAWRDEVNVRRQCGLLLAAIVTGIIVNLTLVEWCLLFITAAGILALELINSSIEALADAVHPSFNPGIKIAKDIAAAAVLVGSLGALVVGIILLALPLLRLLL